MAKTLVNKKSTTHSLKIVGVLSLEDGIKIDNEEYGVVDLKTLIQSSTELEGQEVTITVGCKFDEEIDVDLD